MGDTEWTGRLRKPREAGPGTEVTLRLSPDDVGFRLGDTDLGSWMRDETMFQPWQTLSLQIEGEHWLFSPDRPEDFVAALRALAHEDPHARSDRPWKRIEGFLRSLTSNVRFTSSAGAIAALAITVAVVVGNPGSGVAGAVGGVALALAVASEASRRAEAARTPRVSGPRGSSTIARADDDFAHLVGTLVRGERPPPTDRPHPQERSDVVLREIDLRVEEKTPEDRPDLTRIYGIGEAYARMLAGLGVHTVGDLANADVATIRAIEAHLGDQRERLSRDDWIGQARALTADSHSVFDDHRP